LILKKNGLQNAVALFLRVNGNENALMPPLQEANMSRYERHLVVP
jgi:hypothetical protein